jgi:hypothetical protein
MDPGMPMDPAMGGAPIPPMEQQASAKGKKVTVQDMILDRLQKSAAHRRG